MHARLDLIPLHADEAARMFPDASDPRMYRYLTQRPPPSPSHLEALFERWSAGSPDARAIWLNWVAVERVTDERVGLLQATIDVATRSATIGYSIFVRFQGRRLAREAVASMLARLEARGDVDSVVAEISAPNRASRSVVESLGFALKDRIEGTGRADGRICDDVVYARMLRG